MTRLDPEGDGYFGETVAEHYDETLDAMFDPAVVEPAVDLLAELPGGGRALELGIGTGRIALPLAARGAGKVGRPDRASPRTPSAA
jgi:hypothetical protein